MFVALPGTTTDGAAYIPQALERGAAIVVARPGVSLPQGATARLVAHPEPHLALGALAGAHYGTDRMALRLAGVTGTNGKTTITYLLEHVLNHAGHRAGVIGTVDFRWPGHAEPASHTTPDCLRIHELVAAMDRDGADTAVLEVSSHALDQDRVAGLVFETAALTNVTQDHLDYHKDMESYFRAKRKFFTDYLKDPAKAVLNADDPYGRRLLDEFPQALGFGLTVTDASHRMLSGRILSSTGHGLVLEMAWQGQVWTLRSPLIGDFNASNLLAAQGMALCLGVPAQSLTSLESCMGAPGRLERVPDPSGRHIFVDYAHTPDALENVLRVLRGLDFPKVVAVFGCGGNRDRAKRPLMAQAVARWAHVAVLTSDNPRHEDPEAIMADARPGLAGAAAIVAHPDRRKAIALALERTNPGDALVIAGKGHEPYQQIGDVKHPFSDVTVVKELLGCA